LIQHPALLSANVVHRARPTQTNAPRNRSANRENLLAEEAEGHG